MNKKGRTKLFVISGICLAVLLVSGLIAAADSVQTISENVVGYVENFVEEKGISSSSINNISQVDFNSLPKEVNIENVDDTNLAIYQINYNKSMQKPANVFVITYSADKLESQDDLIISQDKREFLNFGFAGESDSSAFMKTSSGVESSLEKGYVMMRSGSITGISTNVEFTKGSGNAEVIIYRNGKEVQFGNSFVVDSAGTEKDYDTQSKGTVIFESGDIISAYLSADGISWKDANILIEITTTN